MAVTPWLTTNQLVAAVQRKISLPLAQETFPANDVISFLNEEMFISQVPSVLQYHQDYYTTYAVVPLKTNVSRYPMPDRCVGMKLRDIFYMDSQGNLGQMSRIDEHDRAYYQSNLGFNAVTYKFFFEGNEVIMSPGIQEVPSGSLVFVYYLRPNQLVKDDRAAIIENFVQTITINNSLINALDTITLGLDSRPNSPAGFVPLTAVNTLGGSITAITNQSSNTVQIESVAHQLSTGQTVTISGSDSNPSVDGTYSITVIDVDNFYFDGQIGTDGTTGTFTCSNQFQIGGTGAITADNLVSAINSLDIIDNSTSNSNVVSLFYPNIYMTIDTTNSIAFVIPTKTISINFETLPTTYTDSETNETEDLFVDGVLIDFLQTRPGHKIYIYDVNAQTVSGTQIQFNIEQLQIPTDSINAGAGSDSLIKMVAPFVPGDYICLANECIIPYLPPDFHNKLAEMASARILAALGDQAGLQSANAKIEDMERRQANLMSERSDGNPQKVVNRYSSLRMGRIGRFRRW